MAVRRRSHVNHRQRLKSGSRFHPPKPPASVRKNTWPSVTSLKRDAQKRNGQKDAPPPIPIKVPEQAIDGVVVPIPRDRSSYDGDTAIKLYLREIGQVK